MFCGRFVRGGMYLQKAEQVEQQRMNNESTGIGTAIYAESADTMKLNWRDNRYIDTLAENNICETR